jgi:hypothetical protein
MGRLKWGAGVIALTVITLAAFYTYSSRKDCVGLNLDNILELHFEIEDTVITETYRANSTNITSTGILILEISHKGETYDINRISDSLSPAGPNATYSLNRNGNITNLSLAEARRDNATILFSAAKDTGFLFPEIIFIPENGIKIPQNWSSVINFNYTIHTQTTDYSTMIQQNGSMKEILSAIGRKSITTPAGSFKAIEIRYEKTVSWTTSELHPSVRIAFDNWEKVETRSIGTYLIEPKTGIIIQNIQESTDSRFIPNTYTLTLTKITMGSHLVVNQ